MLQLPGHMIAVILPVAEGGVFILLFISLLPEIIHGFSSSLNCWVRKHVEFGLRACGGHILLDMNTRVDVLFLGFFFTDQLVGIYSMAAIFAEACYQLPLVLRTVYNPEVVRLLTQKRIDELKILVSHSRKFAWAGTTIMAVVCVIFMLYVLPLITGHSDYTDGIKYFLVIMAGMLIAAGYVPVGLMLVNAGFPGRQSFMIMILVLTNIIGNAILIPLVGSVGAALATAMTYVLSVLLLKIFVNQYLEFSL
jgi:O-antigen/teichoic acid export membrane protein